jgi:flagellar basal-body rod modification protein FlgD
MAISSIGAVPSTQSTNVQATGIGQDDFLKILLTQLKFQDPLKPLDNQQFIAQMAQFASLEQTRQLNDRLDQLLSIQSSTQSIGLVGRTVQVTTTSDPAVGQIVAISFANGEPRFTIKTAAGDFLSDITLGQIVAVR